MHDDLRCLISLMVVYFHLLRDTTTLAVSCSFLGHRFNSDLTDGFTCSNCWCVYTVTVQSGKCGYERISTNLCGLCLFCSHHCLNRNAVPMLVIIWFNWKSLHLGLYHLLICGKKKVKRGKAPNCTSADLAGGFISVVLLTLDWIAVRLSWCACFTDY